MTPSDAALMVLQWAEAAPDADVWPADHIDWAIDWRMRNRRDRRRAMDRALVESRPWPDAHREVRDAVATLRGQG